MYLVNKNSGHVTYFFSVCVCACACTSLTDVDGLVILYIPENMSLDLLWIIILPGIVTKIHILQIVLITLCNLASICYVKKSENWVHNWECFVLFLFRMYQIM